MNRFVKYFLFIVIGFGILVVAAVGLGVQDLMRPMAGSAQPISFTVTSGERTQAITDRLATAGVIRSSWWTNVYLRVTRKALLPGTYALSREHSPITNIDPLTTGTVTARRVTIPEGLRVNEVAALLEKNEIISAKEFLESARYNPSLVGLPESYNLKADTFLEGFLFPDTYDFPADATANDVLTRMLQNYLLRTKTLAPTYDQLIVASIVEREAKFDEDRAGVAAVYVNRITAGMPLQSNPTVAYAAANAKCGSVPFESCQQPTWWPEPTTADFLLNSPYNTYVVPGLPPRPIDNPGLASITAAVHPAVSDFIYFITDKDGHAHYAKTLTEHNANIAKYLGQ